MMSMSPTNAINQLLETGNLKFRRPSVCGLITIIDIIYDMHGNLYRHRPYL
jgi:hypothetical protein